MWDVVVFLYLYTYICMCVYPAPVKCIHRYDHKKEEHEQKENEKEKQNSSNDTHLHNKSVFNGFSLLFNIIASHMWKTKNWGVSFLFPFVRLWKWIHFIWLYSHSNLNEICSFSLFFATQLNFSIKAFAPDLLYC